MIDPNGPVITLGGAKAVPRQDLQVFEVGGVLRIVDAEGYTPSGAVQFVMNEIDEEDTRRRRIRIARLAGCRAAKGKKGKRAARAAFRVAVGASLNRQTAADEASKPAVDEKAALMSLGGGITEAEYEAAMTRGETDVVQHIFNIISERTKR
ncbi:MAG: hypothetical protein AB7U76_24370 [Pirellulales bacterium]